MAKAVYVHYMSTISTRQREMTQAEWQADIQDALDHNIDGFQFNFGQYSLNQTRVQNFITALDAMGSEADNFKFFPSFDYASGALTEAQMTTDIELWITDNYNHPHHLLHNSIPLFTFWQTLAIGNTFFTNLKADMVTAGTPFSFVPWISVATPITESALQSRFDEWPSMDGFWTWNPGRDTSDAINLNTLSSAECVTDGIEFFAGAGYALFDANKTTSRYVDKLAGQNVTAMMEPLIAGTWTTDNLIIATWNDYGEDHHISPYTPWGPIPNSGTVEVLNHSGYTALQKYYNDWWKTGTRPTVTEEKVILFHMRQLGAGGTPPVHAYNDYTPDKGSDIVHISCILKDAGVIEVTSGSLAPVSFNAVEGVNHFQCPADVGAQSVILRRAAGPVITGVSSVEITDPPAEAWTWSRHTQVFTQSVSPSFETEHDWFRYRKNRKRKA